MAVGKTIRTYFNGQWHDGDVPIMSAADHAAWLGSSVFDGARWFDGVSPDLETIPVYVGEEYLAYYGRKRFDLVREESLSAHLEHNTAQRQSITAGPLYFLQSGSIGDGDCQIS